MIHHIAIDMNRIWLITTEIQTNKSFYSLTKDARGVPQKLAKYAALARPRKLTYKEFKKAKAFTASKDGAVKTVSRFPWIYEVPPVADPPICATRQVLLEWGFFSTKKATKVEVTKAIMDWDTLWQSPL